MATPNRKLARLLVLCLGCAWVLLLGALGGCAGPASTPVAQNEGYTDSDLPDTRKRAINRLKLAVLYFQDGKLSYALDEVKQAINADPDWYEPYWMRGLIDMQRGELALAEAGFQKALALNPGSPDLKHNYGVLLCKLNRPDEGIKMFGEALDAPGYTQRAKTWLEQGVCQLGAGRKADAELSFGKSFAINAGDNLASYYLGLLLYQRGEFEKAQFYTRRINSSDTATAESLWLGMKVERRLGHKEAQEQLGAQLRKRYAQSREAQAYERGAFDE